MKLIHVKYCLALLSLLILFSKDNNAQNSISFDYAPSQVFKHRESLLFDVPSYTQEFRLRYEFDNDPEEEWFQFWNRPRLAVNLFYMDFGDDILGDAIGILPEIRFVLKQWKSISLNLQFGTGAAFAFSPFHPIDNPRNDALGSHFNNTSSLKFGIESRWSDHWSNTLSVGLVHYSNGSSVTPNAGLNIYGVTIGFTYFKDKAIIPDQEILSTTRNNPLVIDDSFNRWNIDLGYQHGFTQFSTSGGPTFSVQDYYVSGGYSFKKFLTTFVGFEYEYNSKEFFTSRNNFYSEKDASKRAKQTALYLEQELRYGMFFNRLRIGYYLDFPSSNVNEVYYKVTTGIYFPKVYGRFRPYVSTVLKAHSTTADYIALSVGIKTEI